MFLLMIVLCLAGLILVVSSAGLQVSLESRLRNHHVVRRLLRNRNWAPPAEAAIQFLVSGKDCPIQGWRKTGAWTQVEAVYLELSEMTTRRS